MGDNNQKTGENNAQVMHSIGQLTGAVHAMHQGLTARIEDIRADMRRAEVAQSDRMDRIEDTLGKRIDNVEANIGNRVTEISDTINKRIDAIGTRVTSLENEDKKIIEKVARMSALGGGVGGALVTAAVEVLKRL